MHWNPSSPKPFSGCELSGQTQPVQQQAVETKEVKPFVITSAFGSGESIPDLYTCKGKDVRPSLHFDGIPEGAKSLALIVDDPDAPGWTWTHWLAWNIGLISDISEDFLPLGTAQGKNSRWTLPYRGPCPPSWTHRYFFTAYVLDSLLDLPAWSSKKQFENAIQWHIIAQYSLMWVYKK